MNWKISVKNSPTDAKSLEGLMMYSHHGSITTIRRLEEEAQILCNEVLSKYLIKPSIEDVKSNLLIYLKRFSASLSSKYHAIERAKANKVTNPGGKNPSNNSDGLVIGLRPTNWWTPDNQPSAYRGLEAFLYEVECKLLDHLGEMAKKDTRKSN